MSALAHRDRAAGISPGLPVVSLAGLVRMKLLSNRDQDRVHLRDMIDVGLFGREMLDTLTPELAKRWNRCWPRRDGSVLSTRRSSRRRSCPAPSGRSTAQRAVE